MAVALVTALGVASYFYTRGRTLIIAVFVALVVYFTVRWLIAWMYRTRYWYHRGTKGHYSKSCPNCGQYIYRRKRDWILQCGRCGWTAGWPGLRWVTHSVPARQLRRTVIGPQLIIVVLAVSALAVSFAVVDLGPNQGATGVSLPNENVLASSETKITRHPSETTDGRSISSSGTTTADSKYSIDTELAEQLIIERTNTVRKSHGLSTLSEGEIPTRFAEQHSQDMGEYAFYAHSGPNGTSPMERMEGLATKCNGPGSENIHRAPLASSVRIYGTNEVVNIYSESQLAEYVIRGWMNSPGHRENMLDERWSKTGVGVYVANDTVYITIVFC